MIRSEAFVAELKGLSATDVKVPVIGGHSGTTILPLLSQVEGVTFTDEEVAALTHVSKTQVQVVNAKAVAAQQLFLWVLQQHVYVSLVKGLQGEEVVDYAYVAVETVTQHTCTPSSSR